MITWTTSSSESKEKRSWSPQTWTLTDCQFPRSSLDYETLDATRTDTSTHILSFFSQVEFVPLRSRHVRTRCWISWSTYVTTHTVWDLPRRQKFVKVLGYVQFVNVMLERVTEDLIHVNGNTLTEFDDVIRRVISINSLRIRSDVDTRTYATRLIRK